MLNNISLKFKAGEKVAILGKVGCGKTTILKLILTSSRSGSVMIDGVMSNNCVLTIKGRISELSFRILIYFQELLGIILRLG